MEFSKIPKVENHLHLEGAIPPETLWQLIQKYGGDESVMNLHQLKEKFIYRDFNHFIEMWTWKNQFIREYDDFVLISEAVFTDLLGQEVKYAEVFISPSLFKRSLPAQQIVEAIAGSIQGITGIKINLIVDLVRDLQVDRIGHGTRAVEDPGLISHLSERKIPIECCPVSNACTRVINSIEEHPIKTFIENGIPVSINTDDPKMFGNSLALEYQTLKDIFGYTNEEIHNIVIDSIDTMWLDENGKTALIEAFKPVLS